MGLEEPSEVQKSTWVKNLQKARAARAAKLAAAIAEAEKTGIPRPKKRRRSYRDAAVLEHYGVDVAALKKKPPPAIRKARFTASG